MTDENGKNQDNILKSEPLHEHVFTIELCSADGDGL